MTNPHSIIVSLFLWSFLNVKSTMAANLRATEAINNPESSKEGSNDQQGHSANRELVTTVFLGSMTAADKELASRGLCGVVNFYNCISKWAPDPEQDWGTPIFMPQAKMAINSYFGQCLDIDTHTEEYLQCGYYSGCNNGFYGTDFSMDQCCICGGGHWMKHRYWDSILPNEYVWRDLAGNTCAWYEEDPENRCSNPWAPVAYPHLTPTEACLACGKMWNSSPSFPIDDFVDGIVSNLSFTYAAENVWAVNPSEEIYFRDLSAGAGWQKIEGALKQISISGDGEHIWGVGSNGNMYYRNGVHGYWQQVPFMKQARKVSVSYTGAAVMVIADDLQIYYGVIPFARAWEAVWFDTDGGWGYDVAISGSGEHAYAVGGNNNVYYMDIKNKSGWVSLEHQTPMNQISVTYDGRELYGVNDEGVYYRSTGPLSKWKKVSSRQFIDQVFVSGDGSVVWAVTQYNNILKAPKNVYFSQAPSF